MEEDTTNLKCKFKLRDDGPAVVNGTIVAWVNRLDENNHEPIRNDSRFQVRYTVDALVLLSDFARGSVYQVPIHRIEIVEESHADNQ